MNVSRSTSLPAQGTIYCLSSAVYPLFRGGIREIGEIGDFVDDSVDSLILPAEIGSDLPAKSMEMGRNADIRVLPRELRSSVTSCLEGLVVQPLAGKVSCTQGFSLAG